MLHFSADKIGTPIAAGAAASRSLTRPVPPRATPLVFRKDQEAVMTIEQHIEELRVELKASTDDTEIAQIMAELEAALNERERLEMQFGTPF